MEAGHSLVEPEVAGQLVAEISEAPVASRGQCRIDATEDGAAVGAWLESKRNLAETTQEHCRVVSKKFLWWMTWRGLTFALVRYQHIDEFIEFCCNLPSNLSTKAPFKRSLSPSSAQQMRIVVNGLFNWLAKARYIEDNPLDLTAKPRGQKGAQGTKVVSRRLSDAEWAWIDRTLAAMPMDTPRAVAHRARARYLFELLQKTGLRLSEICNNTMGGFMFLRSGEAQGWFLEVTGKGDKTRDIPVPSDVMGHVRTYRAACGLSEQIPPGDHTPLIMNITGRKPIGRRLVARIIEEVLLVALNNAKAAGVSEAELAGLHNGSTHWLRHTYGSKLGEAGTPLPVIRDNLGHASIKTSSIYVHSERMRRHAETIKALESAVSSGSGSLDR